MRGSCEDRGVAILLHRTFPMTNIQIWRDRQGRYVAITGKIEGVTINMVSVYAPPSLIHRTLQDLTKLLSYLPPGLTMLGGDFNATPDLTLDVAGPLSIYRHTSAAGITG
ncbi:hypothetical protein NDU88_002285 [Pleurodeles waltl]|uniref:Endonuclease/exonuclease/phosphatase domain-containing protein n=1 Tax=Pleurodeles waltl TaxID=8319 RepID=A0AAV7VEG7_PLEWA|nr:hypothetical protein NDU88_002285 [Pleurodeles waltl]